MRRPLAGALMGPTLDLRADPQTWPGPRKKVTMSEQEQADLRLEYARLKQDHADLDAAIAAMVAMGGDPLRVQRLKKKKLAMKDRLLQLEDKLIPDIIA